MTVSEALREALHTTVEANAILLRERVDQVLDGHSGGAGLTRRPRPVGRFRFGARSLANVETCHPVLQEVLHEAILRTPMDFTVLEGYRGEEEQNRMVERGVSQLRYPKSKHNRTDADGEPQSWAADLAPWWHEKPHIRWDRTDEFRWLAGFVMGIGSPIAQAEGFLLRWGGNWDQDGDHGNSGFVDLPHIELVDIAEPSS